MTESERAFRSFGFPRAGKSLTPAAFIHAIPAICGLEWRPADFPTVGVAALARLKTKTTEGA